MLDDADDCQTKLVDRYGDVLPDSLIRTAVEAAAAPPVAEADVAALADAVVRAAQVRT